MKGVGHDELSLRCEPTVMWDAGVVGHSKEDGESDSVMECLWILKLSDRNSYATATTLQKSAVNRPVHQMY